MKLYNREKFLQLPIGTLFCSGRPWVFEGINVKGDQMTAEQWQNRHPRTCGDYSYLDLCDVECGGSADLCDRVEPLLMRGESVPMNDSYGRDGCFEEGEMYLVYEAADLDRLIEICQQAKAAAV